MSLIGNYLHGWDHLEPTLIGCIARNLNILLLGEHGCGKTSFVQFVSDAMSNGKEFLMVRYAMDKENLLSMVGCPNSKDLAEGKLTYATHQRSIFGADAVLLDELTRAPKDNQNLVLEMLQERTVFGMPLNYQFAVATANDETYKGAMRLDDALYDRFSVVLPVPTMLTGNFGPEEIREMIELNLGKREANKTVSDKALSEAIVKVRQVYQDIWTKTNSKGQAYLRDNVIEFCSKFMSLVRDYFIEQNQSKTTDKKRLSNRIVTQQFPRLIVAIAAYYKVIKDDPEYLQKGAWDAIKYGLSTKLLIPIDKLTKIWETIKDLLTDGDVLIGKVKISLTSGPLRSRVDTVEKYHQVMKDNLEIDEVVNALGNMINEVDLDDMAALDHAEVGELVRLQNILQSTSLNDTCLARVRLHLLHYATKVGILKEELRWSSLTA